MIFTGDISIPFSGAISIRNLPDELGNRLWIGNLEGSLVSTSDADIENLLKRRVVFNNKTAIQELIKEVPFRAFSIANNHIADVAPIEDSLKNLESLKISYVGAGKSLNEAENQLVVGNYVILSCGWNLIKCVYAKENSGGVNPYSIDRIIAKVEKLKKVHPTKHIVVFLHWNYELELYPQPMDRDFAHTLIDIGVYAVIGCHAHRVQPIEFYKGKPIVYGLGNFAFRQNTYMSGKLEFPEFSYHEIAFELRDNGLFLIHHFEYSPIDNSVTYINSETISESNAEFASLKSREYISWFKKHRYQRKALPVFCYKENTVIHDIKCYYVGMRVKMVDLLVKNQYLFQFIKCVMSKLFR